MEARVKRLQSTHPLTPTAAAAAPVSSALGDDDLLREILLRLEFPTSLVRAAAVCRRWLGVASDPAFLRRFRDLYPPRLLGFYTDTGASCWVEFSPVPQFVRVLPQPPVLAAVIRRGGFNLEVLGSHERSATRILDCRSGRVLVLHYDLDGRLARGVYSPLHAARGMSTVPPLPVINVEGYKRFIFSESFSKDGVDGLSYFWFTMMLDWEGKAIARTYMLQDDAWRVHSYATTQLHQTPGTTQLGRTISGASKILSVGDRIYMAATTNSILVFLF